MSLFEIASSSREWSRIPVELLLKKKKKGKPCEAAKANRLTPVSKEKATKSVDLKEVNLVYNIRSHLFIKQEVFKWAI